VKGGDGRTINDDVVIGTPADGDLSAVEFESVRLGILSGDRDGNAWHKFRSRVSKSEHREDALAIRKLALGAVPIEKVEIPTKDPLKNKCAVSTCS